MHQSVSLVTQEFIEVLFNSDYFIDKFQNLQIQTNNDLLLAQSMTQGSSSHFKNNGNAIVTTPFNLQQSIKVTEIQRMSEEISDLIIKAHKQAMYKEQNSIYDKKLNLLEQIQSIKQTLNKISQASSFIVSAKTLPTQQSFTPSRVQPNNIGLKQKFNFKKEYQGEDSVGYLEQSSIQQMRQTRKMVLDDKLNSFSFMNSFLNENRISPQEQEIINQKINASISKIESSIQDRITQIEKQFTRRIQQIMKTIKHLIVMINENQGNKTSTFEKEKKEEEKLESPLIKNRNLQQNTKAINTRAVSSKSTIVFSQSTKIEKQLKSDKKTQNSNMQGQQGQNPKKPSNKLASFFGLGKSNAEK